MIIKLTPEFIANNLHCQAGKRRIEYVDKGGTGLYVEVRATSPGQGTYYLRYKDDNGKTCHEKLGTTLDSDLDTVRKKVRVLRAKFTLQGDLRNDPALKIPTLTEFMEEQLIPYQKGRIRGWARQRDLFRNHLQPTFGKLRLDEITLRSVQQFLTSMQRQGYAASTCNHPVRVLKFAMATACKWRIIETNQLIGVTLFREENQINNIMTETELSSLLTVLRTDKNRMVCSICLFLLSTGARLNEALSARWEHVQISDRVWTIPIAQSKSRRIRSIPLNDSAIDVLNRLDTKGKYEHLFINRKTGKPYVTIHGVWQRRLRIKAKLPFLRLHDLRHNYASFLINSGRTLYDVQKILGHSDPTVTQRYAHLSTKSLQAAADSASDVIKGATVESP